MWALIAVALLGARFSFAFFKSTKVVADRTWYCQLVNAALAVACGYATETPADRHRKFRVIEGGKRVENSPNIGLHQKTLMIRLGRFC
jgi:hypothetical protein